MLKAFHVVLLVSIYPFCCSQYLHFFPHTPCPNPTLLTNIACGPWKCYIRSILGVSNIGKCSKILIYFLWSTYYKNLANLYMLKSDFSERNSLVMLITRQCFQLWMYTQLINKISYLRWGWGGRTWRFFGDCRFCSPTCSQIFQIVFPICASCLPYIIPNVSSHVPYVVVNVPMCPQHVFLEIYPIFFVKCFLCCSQNSHVSPMLFPIVPHFPPYSLPKVLDGPNGKAIGISLKLVLVS